MGASSFVCLDVVHGFAQSSSRSRSISGPSSSLKSLESSDCNEHQLALSLRTTGSSRSITSIYFLYGENFAVPSEIYFSTTAFLRVPFRESGTVKSGIEEAS